MNTYNDVSGESECKTTYSTLHDVTSKSESDYNVDSYAETREIQQDRRGLNMSLGLITVTPNAVYVAADSRTTNTVYNGDNSIAQQTHNDNYQKIVIHKPTCKVVISTGTNEFNGLSLKQLVESNDDIEKIKKELRAYRTNTRIVWYSDMNYPQIDTLFDRFVGRNLNYILGNDAAVDMIKPIPPFSGHNDNDAIAYINSIFTLCIANPIPFNNTIGGKIHILKLEPEKAPFWIQGEYNL